jgi:hypothetical protein
VVLAAIAITKLLPLANRARILAEIYVALELEHTHWRCIGGLWVEGHIPNTRRAILRVATAARVDKVLLRSCMRANKSDKVVRVDSLSGKELK